MGLSVLRGFIGVLLVGATVFTGGTMIRNACWNSGLIEVALILVFGLWALGPYAALGLMAATPRRYAAALAVSLLGAIPPVAFGSWAYVEAFHVNLDAQSGIVFVFVPLLQWGWVALIFVLWAVFRARALAVPSEIGNLKSKISG